MKIEVIKKCLNLFVIFLLFTLPIRNSYAQELEPDYSSLKFWAAHPNKKDPSDKTPDPNLKLDNTGLTDVFYVHPTTFTRKKKKGEPWNASLEDEKINAKTLRTAILHQASIFNGSGRVFAPFYRQAHLSVYFDQGRNERERALEFAYQDVKEAFEYYMQNENKGRLIILASHSQGTNHLERLIKEFFDKKALQEQLVVAYLIGMPVLSNTFKSIPECTSEEQTTCFCSWRTYKSGELPRKYPFSDKIAVTNPLSWETNEVKVEKTRNKGSVLAKFEKGLLPSLVGAQVHKGILWCEKPKFPGSFLITTKNYHIADMNFYYLSIRQNAIKRVASFKKKLNK